ncbi:MAG: hypothetical protein ACRD2I_20635, partial [Vicinamibacterales bacterium]
AQARHDIAEIRPLLAEVLDEPMLARLLDEAPASEAHEDELWVRIVYAFLATTRRGGSVDELANMFVPLYMWRASMFMARSSSETPHLAQARLDALCNTFQRLRPALVSAWLLGK